MNIRSSIIICTHNRPQTLAVTLEGLLKQEPALPKDCQVIVVDNGATEGTKEVISRLKPRFEGRLEHLIERKRGKTNALNTGIQVARGELIIFTDDDVILTKDWIKNVEDCFKNTDADAVGGRIVPAFSSDTPAWIKENLDLVNGPIVSHDYGRETKLYDDRMQPFLGANIVVKKEIFKECGLFKTELGPGQGTFGEDTEFFQRLKRLNKKIYYCGAMVVEHPADTQRANLNYIARWNISSGKFYVMMDEKSFSDNRYRNIRGVPLFIYKSLLKNLGLTVINVFDKRKFLLYWCLFFRDVGKTCEFRKRYKLRLSVRES